MQTLKPHNLLAPVAVAAPVAALWLRSHAGSGCDPATALSAPDDRN
jgi:hypothetical protein